MLVIYKSNFCAALYFAYFLSIYIAALNVMINSVLAKLFSFGFPSAVVSPSMLGSKVIDIVFLPVLVAPAVVIVFTLSRFRVALVPLGSSIKNLHEASSEGISFFCAANNVESALCELA